MSSVQENHYIILFTQKRTQDNFLKSKLIIFLYSQD